MHRKIRALLVTGAATGALAFGNLAPANAGVYFANCTAMHRVYHHGVAKSLRAANRQVRMGHDRPSVRPRVYWAHPSLDRDKDGTACETG